MPSQTVTLELPDDLYRIAHKLARATKRSLAVVLQESLAHTLPPLDDVPSEEADALAQLSLLDDSALWQESKGSLSKSQQEILQALLDRQGEGKLTAAEATHLQDLMAAYGRLLVRQSHA